MNTNSGLIIFVNADLTQNVEDAVIRQLEITEAIDGYEFDQRIIDDPNYPSIIHTTNINLLVIRSFYDTTNRALADIVIFISQGLAYVLSNKVGPPGQTFQVDRMRLERLLNAQTQPPQSSPSSSNVQSNILHPLFPHNFTNLYPFGSDPIKPDDDDDDNTEDE